MIDTALKRRSAAGVTCPMFGPGVTPDETKPEAWRQSVGFGYAGISATNEPPVAAGVITVEIVTAASVSLSATAATNGTPPYTYQWHCSLTPGFTPSPSTAMDGATTLSISDFGLTPDTVYYYTLVVLDYDGGEASASVEVETADADPLDTLYTTDSGPGQTTAQTAPGASIGGFAASTAWIGGVRGDLFGMASSADITTARPDYRCVYVYNPSEYVTVTGVRAYLTHPTAGSAGLFAGVDPRPVTYVDSSAAQAVEPGSGYTAPSGVTFSDPTNYASGIVLGDLPPGAGRAVWFRRIPVNSVDTADEAADVVITDNGGNTVVRRISWWTEPATVPTTPYRFPQYQPTPSPFQRVTVDFLTTGYSRITWELDPSMADEGPYDYRLQYSQVGSATADDWSDVGSATRDASYLIDPDRRLWGVSATTHYRVILTTAVGTYVSRGANVYGVLSREQWLLAQEVFRKERLMLRRLTGTRGYLLKARRYGTRCPNCVNATTGEIGNSSCSTCYGQGISGGYQMPIPYQVVDQGNEDFKERVAYNENLGTIGDAVVIKARAVAEIPVASRDAWILEGSDRRYYVHRVSVISAFHGVPIVYDVEFRYAPRSDVLYNFAYDRPPDQVPFWAAEERISV